MPDQAYLPDGEEEKLMIEREKHVWSKLQVCSVCFLSKLMISLNGLKKYDETW